MYLRAAARTCCTAALACAAIAQNLDPQEARLAVAPYFPVPAVTIRTETRLVEVEAVVRDSQGRPVGGLTKSDFQIRDSGKPREISAFSVQKRLVSAGAAAVRAPSAVSEAPAPSPSPEPQTRWVAIVFDDFDLPPADLSNAKAAARRFLKDGLSANDQVSVLTTSRGTVAPFTAEVAKISEGIDNVSLEERKVRSGVCPLITPYEANVIADGADVMATVIKSLEYISCNSTACPDTVEVSPGVPVSSAGLGCTRGAPRCPANMPPVAKAACEACLPVPCDAAIDYVKMASRQLWEQIRQHSWNSLRTLGNIVDSMARLKGTRVILFASSGFLSSTLEYEEDQLVDKALRANVVINSLDAKGLYTIDAPANGQTMGLSGVSQQLMGTRPKDALNDTMGNLADSTGGLFFHNNNDLDLGFRQLGMQPEVSYLLGFAPGTLDNKYHTLKVSLTAARHATVQARQGYIAALEKPEQEKPRVERRLDREVFTNSQLEETPVTVTTDPDKTPEGKSMARLTFHLDIGKVQFHTQAGARSQTYHMIAALLDAQGIFVTGVEAVLDLSLKEATYQRELTPGLNAYVRLEAPAGSYRLRTVVAEGSDAGRYSTATQTAEIK